MTGSEGRSISVAWHIRAFILCERLGGGCYVLRDCLECFFRLVFRFEAREEVVELCQGKGGVLRFVYF